MIHCIHAHTTGLLHDVHLNAIKTVWTLLVRTFSKLVLSAQQHILEQRTLPAVMTTCSKDVGA
jgi:hypothetical protein